jgi:hypothetical protein
MGDAKHELLIDEAILYIRQVKISPTVMLQNAMALEKVTIKYPLTRVKTIQYTINKGVVRETFDNVSSGILLKRIIFGMTQATATQGSYSKNPFNLKKL